MVNLICGGPIIALKNILGVVCLQVVFDHDVIATTGEQCYIVIINTAPHTS